MISKDTILNNGQSSSLLSRKPNAHMVRYRTYLTPPSNPFRESKSKLQLLREAVLILAVCALVAKLGARFLNFPTKHPSLVVGPATFETQLQQLRRDTSRGLYGNTQHVENHESAPNSSSSGGMPRGNHHQTEGASRGENKLETAGEEANMVVNNQRIDQPDNKPQASEALRNRNTDHQRKVSKAEQNLLGGDSRVEEPSQIEAKVS
jgi:hypothetical protein